MLKFLNPLTWLNGAASFFAWLFGPILRAFGYFPHPSVDGFENLQAADVADEARLATEKEAAVEELRKEVSPADIVRAYARADAAGRVTMDLSALDLESQHWLLNLSDGELALLSISTVGGCARSLEKREVLPSYAKQSAEKETLEILAVPSEEELEQAKRDFVSARFNELFFAPGVPIPRPRFVPDTLH